MVMAKRQEHVGDEDRDRPEEIQDPERLLLGGLELLLVVPYDEKDEGVQNQHSQDLH